MNLFLKNNTRIPLCTGILFFILSAVIRFFALNQTPYANGWDGYYYVMQAHSFLEFGHLQSLDYSLIYPYFILFSSVISDYELAFKIGAAILAALFTYSSFRITYLFSERNIYIAILVAALTIFSPGTTFFTSQFPKNLLGILFIVWVPLFIVHKKYLKAVLFIVLSAFTHRMTGGIGIMLLVITLLTTIPKKYVIIGASLLVIISLLPGLFHISDFQRFNGQLSSRMQFAPIKFMHLGITKHQILWKIEVYSSALLCISLFLFIIIQSSRQKKMHPQSIMILGLITLVFFPFFTITSGSMGYRFFLLIFMLYPILLGILLTKIPVQNNLLLLTSGVLLVSSFYSYKSYNPRIHDAPNELYHHMVSEIKQTYDHTEYSLIIAHKSLAEVIIFKTNFDALNWAAPQNISKNKVLRIVEGIPFRFIEKYVDINDHYTILQLSTLYFVIPEITWNTILEKATKQKDTYLLYLIKSGNNPLKSRPYYLKKGKNI